MAPKLRAALAFALAVPCAFAAAADAPKSAAAPGASTQEPRANVAEAERNRKKPLQRCDQLSGQAQLECLEQARERIVDARAKRQTSEKERAAK